MIPGYRTLAQIAEGGSTFLYKAIDERTGQNVALKVMQERFLRSDSAWHAFLCDLLARSVIDAPCVPRVLACGFAPLPYSASTFVEGETLLGQQAPPDADLTAFISAGCTILSRLHATGLQPMDINPTNWVFTDWRAPSFVDFGDVRASAQRQADVFSIAHSLTPASLTEAVKRFAALMYYVASGRDVVGEWAQFYENARIPVQKPLPLTHWRADLPQASALLAQLLTNDATPSAPFALTAPTAEGDLERLQRARLAEDVHIVLPCGGAQLAPFFHGSRFDALARLSPEDPIPARFQRWLDLHVATGAPLTLAFLSPEHADPLTLELLRLAQASTAKLIL